MGICRDVISSDIGSSMRGDRFKLIDDLDLAGSEASSAALTLASQKEGKEIRLG